MKNEGNFDSSDFIAQLRGISTEQYINEGLKNSVTEFNLLKQVTDKLIEVGISMENYHEAVTANDKLSEAFVFCFNHNLKDDYERLFELNLKLAQVMHKFCNDSADKVCNDSDKHLLRYLIANKVPLANEDKDKIVSTLVENGLIYLTEEDQEYCLIGLHIATHGPEFDEDDDEMFHTQLQAYVFDSDRFYGSLSKLAINELPKHYEIIEDHSPKGGKHVLKLNCTVQDRQFVKEFFTQ